MRALAGNALSVVLGSGAMEGAGGARVLAPGTVASIAITGTRS